MSRGEQAKGESGWPPHRFAAIVGAPRCGTTMLARLLERHPAVSFSKVKEPHFFTLADLDGLHGSELRAAVADHYLDRFFPEIDPNAQIIAEGSVSYLYAPEKLLPLLELWPEAKFVISLRDPMEMIPSLHQRLLYQGDETEKNLERAWALIGERRAGRKVPRTCLDARQLFYDEAGSHAKHLSRFFEIIGRERCHVVLFDDLRADPQRVHREMIEFLGLAAVPFPELPPQREARGFRIGWLQRLLKRPPVARTVLAGEKFRRRVSSAPAREASAAARTVMRVRKALLRWNRAPAPAPRVSPELARDIRERLSDDVRLLSKMLDRDLSHWLGGIGRSEAAAAA
jgi:hypothetical protein